MHAEGLRSARAYCTISDAMNRGDFAAEKAEFDATLTRLESVIAKGWANREYGTAYLRRFLSKTVMEGAAATAAPNHVVQVLPDRWRFTFDDDDSGNTKGFHRADFADAAWPAVATLSATLDTQGYDKNTIFWYRTKVTVPEKSGRLALFFGEVDGKAEVYVNGEKIAIPEGSANVKKPATPGVKEAREGMAKPRTPFEVDVTAAIKKGENTVAVRVDHTQITDLSLGGIIRPVLLIAKPEAGAAK